MIGLKKGFFVLPLIIALWCLKFNWTEARSQFEKPEGVVKKIREQC